MDKRGSLCLAIALLPSGRIVTILPQASPAYGLGEKLIILKLFKNSLS
ncbi:MAG: hypothetical protein SAJ37_08245 [Oscillatoria sp. PMC 1068.18]|nr:hypothetical protein [Oscillatoria sp. PMC 1076.18]MEC4988725.1 hypothetical protein [Oscillatoria sp. PMC 1068.18]